MTASKPLRWWRHFKIINHQLTGMNGSMTCLLTGTIIQRMHTGEIGLYKWGVNFLPLVDIAKRCRRYRVSRWVSNGEEGYQFQGRKVSYPDVEGNGKDANRRKFFGYTADINISFSQPSIYSEWSMPSSLNYLLKNASSNMASVIPHVNACLLPTLRFASVWAYVAQYIYSN